nr:HAMP domain-containing sensor histidine kinase [Desulfobacteraceae bacterium]
HSHQSHGNRLIDSFFMAFSVEMLPMAVLYTVLGGLFGIAYGKYANILIEKNRVLAEKEYQLRHQVLISQKQASLGVMAGSIGHEVKNILTTIMGYCELIQAEGDVPYKIKDDLEEIFTASTNLEKLATSLLNLGRPNEETSFKRINVCDIIDATTATLIACGTLKRVTIEKNCDDPDLFIDGDPFLLEQAIRNIELNAAQAMNDNGTLIIKAAKDLNKSEIYIEIQDFGQGIPETHIHRIFDPFYSTKLNDKGNGLGLSIVKQITESFGGTVEAKNAETGGAIFTFRFPAKLRRSAREN